MKTPRLLSMGQILLLACCCLGPSSVNGQSGPFDELRNGGMENSVAEERLEAWQFSSRSGGQLRLDSEKFYAGKQSAMIDAAADSDSGNYFSNLSQSLNGIPFRGKRVRFRAAVCTSDLNSDAKAQLWFRVDRKSVSGERLTGAFDNMQKRPIRSESWNQHEIVLPVDADADKIFVGVFLTGQGKAWIDDASLEIVDDATLSTAEPPSNSAGSRTPRQAASPSRFPPVLMKAFRDAENAPSQPFFTPWLWLVLAALILFGISVIPPKPTEVMIDGQPVQKNVLGVAAKFALRFSVAYWLLYSFPKPFVSLLSYLGMIPFLGTTLLTWVSKFLGWYNERVSQLVHWTALNVFGIEGELVPLNGSGDTTFAYVNLFAWFVLSVLIASLWSILDWRKTDYRMVKDLLRSYLRYVVAFAMLGYGLSKFGWAMNQFPEPGASQLLKNYGDASPMNLVWTFMGASRPYTMFAGLGEIVGALLLIWRRTTTLGAMVVFCVMLNVVMLNMCYDVPVKIYSFHLVCMAVYLMLPDFGRLGNILFWNRSTEKVEYAPPYTGSVSIWIQRTVKAIIILGGFAIPIYSHIHAQTEFFSAQAELPDFFGIYEVEEYQLNGEPVSESETAQPPWFAVEFNQKPYSPNGRMTPTNYFSVILKKGAIAPVTFTIVDESTLDVSNHTNELVPQGEIQWNPLDDDRMLLTGETSSGKIEVKLHRRGKDLFRLTGRGFRWINEVPFNR